MSHVLNYKSVIDNLCVKHGLNPIVIPYDGGEGFLSEFFMQLKIDISGSRKQPRKKNKSLDPIDCMVKNKLFNLGISSERLKEFNKFAINKPIRSGLSFIDRNVAKKIASDYGSSNKILISRYKQLSDVLDLEKLINFTNFQDIASENVQNQVKERLFEFVNSRKS